MLPSALTTKRRNAVSRTLRQSLIASWRLQEQATATPKLDSSNRYRNDIAFGGGGAAILSPGPATQSTILMLGPSRLTLPHDPMFNVGTTSFTFAFWQKVPTGALQTASLSKRLHDADERTPSTTTNPTWDEYIIYKPANLFPFRFAVRSSTLVWYEVVSAQSFVSTAIWLQIVAWRDRTLGTLNLRVSSALDGIFRPADSIAFTEDVNENVANFQINSLGNNHSPTFAITATDWSFYRRVLSEREQAALFNVGRGRRV